MATMATMATTTSEGPSFFLVGDNERARNAILEPANEYYLRTFDDGTPALSITLSSDVPEVTVGSSGADIYLPDAKHAEISKRHCSFVRDRETRAVVLHDKSKRQYTEVSDNEEDRVIPIQNSVVVSKGFNRRITIGYKKYYQFEIRWHADAIAEYLQGRATTNFGPWGAKEYRYVRGEDIGAGAFGSVFRAVDIRDGKAMAVKRFHNIEGKRKIYAMREIQNMFKINNHNSIKHDHILEIFDTEEDPKEKWLEMFMPLKHGSLKMLARRQDLDTGELATAVLYQMLLALKSTTSHKLVHRDLKPDNILYETKTTKEGQEYFHFWLADFGLSHDAAQARTKAGTEPFMAPEVLKRGPQTPKMDIWSLFAVIVWIHDIADFRTECWRVEDVHGWLVGISKMAKFSNIKSMARMDPEKRFSARRLLESKSTFADVLDESEIEPEGGGDGIEGVEGAMAGMTIQGGQGTGYGHGDQGAYAATPNYQAGVYGEAAAYGGVAPYSAYNYGGNATAESSAGVYGSSMRPRGDEYGEGYYATYPEYPEYAHGVVGQDYQRPGASTATVTQGDIVRTQIQQSNFVTAKGNDRGKEKKKKTKP